MTNAPLKIGSFYWVKPTHDPDSDAYWENELQPARYAGKDEYGDDLWHYLGIENSDRDDRASHWPICFIGDEIVPPTES